MMQALWRKSMNSCVSLLLKKIRNEQLTEFFVTAHPGYATNQLNRVRRGHKHYHRHNYDSVETNKLTTANGHGNDKRDNVKVPVVSNVKLLGGSSNSPAEYYFPNQVSAALPTIALNLLVGTIEDSVSTNFGAWNGSGNIEVKFFVPSEQ